MTDQTVDYRADAVALLAEKPCPACEPQTPGLIVRDPDCPECGGAGVIAHYPAQVRRVARAFMHALTEVLELRHALEVATAPKATSEAAQ